MSTVYLHQEAGWSLNEDQFGEDNPCTGTWTWTITIPGGVADFRWTLTAEDGTYPVSLYNAGISGSYQYNWALLTPPTYQDDAGACPKIVRTMVGINYAERDTYLDAEWSEANTGDDLTGGDTFAVAFFDWSNPSGRGTYPDGTNLRYCRDLSGNERTAYTSYPHTILSSANTTMEYVAADQAVTFDSAGSLVTSTFTSSAWWTLIVRAKFTAADVAHDIAGTAGDVASAVYLAINSTNHVVAKTRDAVGNIFTATSANPIDPTQWHTYWVSRSADTLTVEVDNVEVATAAVTGAASVATVALGINRTVDGHATAALYSKVKLYSEPSHREPGTVNLAPSPGGVLTATAEPRSRVRLGMSVSPDGGSP